ncbi:TraM recognition domain-containing protein [Chryseobacterium sp. CBSDS_008]|uniref:TraM recognition domain-containing protein n=1 Tax=Chryseobacterium sp. CBSDS_008 TaxID=3415265 RepID=UPI003CF78624
MESLRLILMNQCSQTSLSNTRANQYGLRAGMQGIPQLQERLKSSEDSAIVDISSNLICGKAGNETAKYVSERLGKTNQRKTTINESSEGEFSFGYTTDKDYLVSQPRS